MVEAYRQLSEVTDHPLHLGVTEAGPPPAGLVKATAGIATLLLEGIGDTIRYSLTADPVEEARAGRQLLEALGLRERKNVDLIACPSCGRAEIDVIDVANRAMEAFGDRKLPLQVAVMGCVVNGPGEAREADLGIAAGNKRGHLFVKGRNVAVVPEADMVDALVEWAEFINEHGIEAAIARVDTALAEREAAKDRAALLDEQGRRRQPRRGEDRRDPHARPAATSCGPMPTARCSSSTRRPTRSSTRPSTGRRSASRAGGDVLVRQRRGERTAGLDPVHNVPFEHGDHAICIIEHRGDESRCVSPGVGAPAAVTSLEVLIALGATNDHRLRWSRHRRAPGSTSVTSSCHRRGARRGHQLPLRAGRSRRRAAPARAGGDRRRAHRRRRAARPRSHVDDRCVLPRDARPRSLAAASRAASPSRWRPRRCSPPPRSVAPRTGSCSTPVTTSAPKEWDHRALGQPARRPRSPARPRPRRRRCCSDAATSGHGPWSCRDEGGVAPSTTVR